MTDDAGFAPHGKHLIAGEWVAGEKTFRSEPAHGAAHDFGIGTPALVDRACQAAEEAFWSYGYSTREDRAAFLEAIAEEIDAREDAVTQIGTSETGLPEGRLVGERGRTVGQLRLFASHIRDGAYLDLRHDAPLPDRQPAPRPDLRMVQRPIGPVAVFGASNFPLAFSTAGGDTAAALAAGCPVVVKGHSAHPGTGEIIAEAIHAAIKRCDIHPGVFSLIQGGRRDVGTALVQHPLINAVGFTGSLAGGRALFDLCAARPNPIPFFGELGSVNPVFLFPSVLADKAESIAEAWAGSLTMGAGQFCTNPGIVVVQAGSAADRFLVAATKALKAGSAQTMLTDGIAEAFQSGKDQIASMDGVTQMVSSASEGRTAAAQLLTVKGSDFLANPALAEEVFGPLGLVVLADSADDMLAIAKNLKGQLTVTAHFDDADHGLLAKLMPIIERKAGRLVGNGFPTGVEVADAMVHGGPYPASTNFGATSVGTLSIRRFLRPVCYQDLPEDLLPLG
ncbi:aldehyde dehydrogenase (NADP(+)) [Aliiroseovarius sediminis]|uniref:aldehyde dehydrogenase (NADP(+)) n=1 Tax=Aliiroseovarius sediminis TaxID=2925839 RepID=UPI001F5935DB|nr:aldehyde dehydrogenase (NADP(+)) [Aliiroseovarius sediminis]MCI2395062.1 aldehyde dehydrogenase (NADP(+)) [Aliiroseovarius sediminis]